MAVLKQVPFEGPLSKRLAQARPQGVSLFWLGQAGFIIDVKGRRIVVDPYLSDSLAFKYRDSSHSHARMACAPVTVEELGPVDLVLCTHHHTDHMDGETLQRLAMRLPHLKFVVPAASGPLALQRLGVAADRLIEVDAGESMHLPAFRLQVMRAAHESVEQDEQGRHRFLGYGLDFGTLRIFHSGDTIPFEGQDDEIMAFAPDLALLPVNGRSEALKSAGFAGNLTLAEATSLCKRCGIAVMIAHHYGMFAFNTIEPEVIDDAAQTSGALVRAREGIEFRLDAA
ncbi:hypothetical protein AX760_16445 [Pararhizobium antarcticum]|uniref:Metallo-beta-lactamase domain-containing protein n=2 Tax=Pararhizobium antarcticum TaxID=1798805 RepID=A0A657LUH2_9HYPH|nr:hypothetical protein AX760_16445 [Pararhizobium antarcticum]OJF99864.1 hypothetical protein AX761_09935 [Rhizobium sp. 58]